MLFRSLTAVLAAAVAVQAVPQPEASASNQKQDGGFEVKIVYVRPQEGCTAPPTTCQNVPDGTIPAPTLIEEVTAVSEPTRAKPKATATESKKVFEAPVATLKPAVHWSVDTKSTKRVVPVPPTEGNKLYYGLSNPAESGSYAFLTYYFDQPSVNLDQCGQVKDVVYSKQGLAVTFKSAEAYKIAQDTWSGDDGMVLITYTEGCGAYDKEDRCYFKVTGLTYNNNDHTILALGTPGHPSDLVSKGESEWGWWTPEEKDKSSAKSENSPSAASASGSSFSWNPSASTPAPEPKAKTRSGCVAGPDTKNGLPSACFGKLFDIELDDHLGSKALTAEQKSFLEKVKKAAGNDATLTRRGCGWFCNAWDKVKEGAKDTFDKVKDTVENVVDGVKDVVEDVKDKVGDVVDDVKDKVDEITTFSGDFDHDITYKVPDPNDPLTSKLIGSDLVQSSSPWGPAILLKSFGIPEGLNVPAGVDAHLNVYCVNCGVSGTARIAGRATWKPLEGVTEAQVELWNDMQFMLQLGIDAQVSYKYNFETELFGVGLPGLSFGVITIGPYISVGTKIALEAAANGRLLTGAEMGLQNAHVMLDLVHGENTKADSWDPYVKPIFEVEGDIKLSASLGLPVGIKCGIKIATFDLSAGIVDEPSIKGLAQVSASIGMNATNHWEAGFKEIDGCTGISSQLTWRNQLYADITGFSNINLHDTGDMPLARGCIELPHVQPIRRRMIGGNKYHDAAVKAARSAKLKSLVVDLTGETEIKGASDHVTYGMKALPPAPFKDASGRQFSTIVSPSAKNLIASCSNGNVYAFPNKPINVPACSAMWTSVDGTLVGDGSQRVTHYYNNTMSKLGVSRLRVAEPSKIPESGAVVAWAPYSENKKDSDDYIYIAVDSKEDVFYPMVCQYENNQNPKVFLVADPVKGAETLKSKDVQHTVTGGNIKECYPLSLKQGAASKDHSYGKYTQRR